MNFILNPIHEEYPPTFATNNIDSGETVAEKINLMLEGALEDLKTPFTLKIATAYFNIGGYESICKVLHKLDNVQILLGADPKYLEPDLYLDKRSKKEWLKQVLNSHDNWMRAERDLTGFSKQVDDLERELITWLTSTNNQGVTRVEVRRFGKEFLHGKAFIIEHKRMSAVLAGSANFTLAGLTKNRELNIGYPQGTNADRVIQWFDELWEQSEPYNLAELYEEKFYEHSPMLIFLRMLDMFYANIIEKDKDDVALNLTPFQKDGVSRAKRLLAEHGGVIIADEVGLGKTFIAGEIIKQAVDIDRQNVLVICPAALKDTVWEPFLSQYGISRRAKVMSYDELWRKIEDQESSQLSEIEDSALVVIDEAHNLRNESTKRSKAIIRILGGEYPKKTLLLTATPVNNSLNDLNTLISYFIKDDGHFANIGIPSVYDYIKAAQDMDPELLSPEHLFDLMDQVAVRRTRRFIKQNYSGDRIRLPDGQEQIIQFPQPRLKRIDYEFSEQSLKLLESIRQALVPNDDEPLVVSFADRHFKTDRLLMARYVTSLYLKDGDLAKYQISNSGLLRSGLLKRLESSTYALSQTLARMIKSHEKFLSGMDQGYVLIGDALSEWTNSSSDNLDTILEQLDDKENTGVSSIVDFHANELRQDVQSDLILLNQLHDMAHHLTNSQDPKIIKLIDLLREIAINSLIPNKSGINPQNLRKTVIFSTFADTIQHIHEKVNEAIKNADPNDPLSLFKNRVAHPIYGIVGGRDQETRAKQIACFAPETASSKSSNGKPTAPDLYDLLFATDVLSEGVNLQQAGKMINYDLPWNPMRLVQRSGRIDRIGSAHSEIYISCFFPGSQLENLLHLEDILTKKLKYAIASVGAHGVLPNQDDSVEVILNDSQDQIMSIAREDIEIFDVGDTSVLSGEEYRIRLSNAYNFNATYKTMLQHLPYGSGSGFVSAKANSNYYVFCLKMGSTDKVWFRRVATDQNWDPMRIKTDDSTGLSFEISADTLTALSTADPENEDRQRYLPMIAYDKAYDAFIVARDHAFKRWQYLTNPNNLTPDIEKVFRDAVELVNNYGTFLGNEKLDQLAKKLSGRWKSEIKVAVRSILNNETLTNEEKVRELDSLSQAYGLEIPKRSEPLPPLDFNEIHLVAWMAVANKYTSTDTVQIN